MERAGRLLSKLGRNISDEQLAIAAWPAAVGKKIASRTSPVTLVRTRLVVNVEDAIWQRQLFTLRSQILNRLHSVLGQKLVEELEFKIAIPKREPARAEQNTRTGDEADLIVDQTFRSIYRSSRKKNTA